MNIFIFFLINKKNYPKSANAGGDVLVTTKVIDCEPSMEPLLSAIVAEFDESKLGSLFTKVNVFPAPQEKHMGNAPLTGGFPSWAYKSDANPLCIVNACPENGDPAVTKPDCALLAVKSVSVFELIMYGAAANIINDIGYFIIHLKYFFKSNNYFSLFNYDIIKYI